MFPTLHPYSLTTAYWNLWPASYVASVTMKRSLIAKLGLACCLVALSTVPVASSLAQAPSDAATQLQAPPRIEFEVVSIRPHKFTGDDPSSRQLLPGGRFVVSATTVRTFIRIACVTDDERMTGAPGWLDKASFDIDAITADHAEVKTPEQFQQLILSLLEERFAFKFHRESKEGSVYWLELDKAGKTAPGLRLADAGEGANMSTGSNGPRATMKITNQSMADVAAALRRQAAARPLAAARALS